MADKDFKVKTGIDLPSPLPASEGGTGQTSLSNAFNALLPAQSGQNNKVLTTDGTNTAWAYPYARGNTASRPGSPTAGDIYVNTETGFIEIYTGATYGWEQVGGVASTVTNVAATDQGTGRAYNNGQASISFTPGTIAGRTYTVTSNPGSFTNSGSSSPILITGLQSSTQYTYTVVASNNYGTAAASAASAGVTATTVPQAPTIGTATASGTDASITFTPGATGGAAATYTATSNPGGLTGTSSSSPITISSLTIGETYTFTVTATNSNGTSLASAASNSVTIASDAGSMVPLGAFTLSGTQATVEFTNIPQTYKHLQIKGISRTNRSDPTNALDILYMQFNNDTGSNYTRHFINGDGSSASSFGEGDKTFAQMIYTFTNDAISNTFAGFVSDILDYSDTNKFKTARTLLGGDRNGAGFITLNSNLWRSTSAITSIKIYALGSFVANSSFALYGIKGE